MNKCKFTTLIVALVLLVPCLAFALPGAHDPASGNGYVCNSCHANGATMGNLDSNYASNVCLRCHSTSGVLTGKTTKNFAPEDYANPFKTTTLTRATALQTSHKWFSADVVPAAGAVRPVDTSLNGLNKSANFVSGGVFCARCHNVHGNSGIDSNSAPYLRYPNDSDQLCLNCHRPRDTKDHTAGTHPVNVSYTSASVKAKVSAGKFLATPASRPNNVSGQVSQVKLVKGMVVCSTCHKTHNSDSRTSTFDPYSSTHTFGGLSSSKGYLLRVDAKGKAVTQQTADNLNICTNCHAGKMNHNAGGQNIQCNDCHGAHVEYDPIAEPIKNVNLVRRYNTYSASTGGFNKKRVLFRYTAASKREYYNSAASKTGVCQGCHNPSASHFTGGVEANGLLGTRVDCATCHKHNDNLGSFKSSGCDGCHGLPPVSLATTAAQNSPAYTGDETTAPHSTHASGGTGNYSYNCIQCHNGSYGAGATHNSNPPTYQSVFVTPVAVTPGGVISGSAPNYDTGTTQCSAVYCHSDGTSTTVLGSPKSVTWAAGKGTITTCDACHAAVPTTGSHDKHASSGLRVYGCVTCHSATVSDNTTISDTTKHVNAVKDVQITGASPANGTYTEAGKTCAVACHNNGKGTGPVTTPVWGSPTTGACGACHATKTNGNLATNGHATHLTAAITTADDTSCVTCHNTYTAYNVGTHVNGTLEAPAGCNTNNCHGSIKEPTWTISLSGKDSCTKCHGTLTNTGVISVAANNTYLFAPMTSAANPAVDAGKVSANAKKGAHETHLRFLNGFSNYSTVDYRCQGCHGPLPATAKHSNGSSTPVWSANTIATNHGSRTTGSLVYDTNAKTCSNTYCHSPAGSNGMVSAGTAPAPVWTDATYIDNTGKNVTNCSKCHGVPNGSFANHGTMTTDAGTDCSGCHGHNGDASGVAGQRHMDGIRYANGACDTCHGYPPVSAAEMAVIGTPANGNYVNARLASYNGSNYSDATSSHHTTHLLATVKATDGFGPCLPCHPQTTHHNVTNTVLRANVDVMSDINDLTYRFDDARSKRYNRTATTGTCSNISCHFQPTPAW